MIFDNNIDFNTKQRYLKNRAKHQHAPPSINELKPFSMPHPQAHAPHFHIQTSDAIHGNTLTHRRSSIVDLLLYYCYFQILLKTTSSKYQFKFGPMMTKLKDSPSPQPNLATVR